MKRFALPLAASAVLALGARTVYRLFASGALTLDLDLGRRSGTEIRWQGELGTDLWALGERWGGLVARAWTRAVRASLDEIAAEDERRAHGRRADPGLSYARAARLSE